MAELKFSVKGLDKIRGSIGDMEERAKNLEPVLKGRAETLNTLIDDSFEKSRSPLGEKWSPLSPATVRGRRRGSSKPLVDTGVLRQSSFAQASKNSILFGVSGEATSRGAAHQFGTKKSGRNRNTVIPARPFLPVSDTGKPSFSSGPALKWLERLRKRIITYIIRGKV